MLFQPPLPTEYASLTDEEMCTAITERKQTLGSRLMILGHHYQKQDVIQFADFTGDSLKLAKLGAEQRGVDYIVFCGVHFMAEAADILTDDDVKVIIIGGRREDHEQSFAEVRAVTSATNRWAMPYEQGLTIYVAREPRSSLAEIWPHVKHYN